MMGSMRTGVADGHTDGQTDGAGYIGPADGRAGPKRKKNPGQKLGQMGLKWPKLRVFVHFFEFE